MRNHFTLSRLQFDFCFLPIAFKKSRALCILVCHIGDKAMKKIPNNIKKQTETVITITTHRAKVDVHKYEATNGQATTLTGFLATNRLDVPRERKGQRWDKWQRQRRKSSHVSTWDSHNCSHYKGSPQAALHHHHTQQVKRLTLDNSHHVCLLRLSGLRAADVQKKVKWFIVTWRRITQKNNKM